MKLNLHKVALPVSMIALFVAMVLWLLLVINTSNPYPHSSYQEVPNSTTTVTYIGIGNFGYMKTCQDNKCIVKIGDLSKGE